VFGKRSAVWQPRSAMCDFSSPPNPEADAAKEKFAAINAYVTEHGGWLVSVPGDPEMRLQTLPGSALPDQLAALGYIVERTGETQRILPHAVAQKFEVSSSGALVSPTGGSTKPTSVVVTNAGIAIVEVYDLRMP
jgi:hypothetical protein